MSTRRKPVATIGDVHVLGPTASSPYYRLTWTEPDGRPGRTTGELNLEGAKSKAREIDADLRRATGPKALTPLGVIVREYLSTGEGRNQKTGEDCSGRTLLQQSETFSGVMVPFTGSVLTRTRAGFIAMNEALAVQSSRAC